MLKRFMSRLENAMFVVKHRNVSMNVSKKFESCELLKGREINERSVITN
jgi:hypothetical protein